MELRRLRYFVAVAEELSFRAAAARLNVAQSALSVQVRQLESEVGAGLLTRERRSVRLTEAGALFLPHARQILAHAKQAAELAHRAARGEIGQLSIRHLFAAELLVLKRVVPAFRARWPDVQFTFHSLDLAEQYEALHAGRLDLGFVWLPAPSEELDVAPLATVSFVVGLPSQHRLARQKSVAIKDLSGEPLVQFARTIDPDAFDEIEQRFQSAGATMNVVTEVETSVSALNFIGMGVGCGLLPDYVKQLPHEGVIHRPLRSTPLKKTLAIVKKRGRGGIAGAFYEFTRGMLAKGVSAHEES